MRRMPRRLVVCVACAALGPAACGDDKPALSTSCTEGPAAIEQALRDAPGKVLLADGTPLSHCVRDARTDAELQNVGIVLTGVAEDLEADAPDSPPAALRLGYLIGAARRGAPGDSSLQAELVHRLERSAALELSPAAEQALAEGMRAGERTG